MHRVEKYASSGFAAATAKRLKRSMFHALIADDDLAMHKHALQCSSTLVRLNGGNFSPCVNLTKNSRETAGRKQNRSGAATFFFVAQALGNVPPLPQRLAKSTLDGPYKNLFKPRCE
jgi:hypothetical protein